MNTFVNDYNDLCHPRVWEALEALASGHTPGYGYDEKVEGARRLIQEALGAESSVYFLPGATACNMLGLTYPLKRHEAVISPVSGHIENDEVGSIEAKGHKIVTIEDVDGKIGPEALEACLASFGAFYNVLPGIVYVSQTTEKGTVYSLSELEDLYRVSKDFGVYFFIDGARLGSALDSSYSKMGWGDLAGVCDIFSIGGTKNGALFGDALVFNDTKLAEGFNFYMKQQGSLLAKSFLIGVQFEALFTGGLYDQIAHEANEAARALARGLKGVGADFWAPPQSNQIFIKLASDDVEKLADVAWFEEIEEADGVKAIRFVTTYRTREEEVQALVDRVGSF